MGRDDALVFAVGSTEPFGHGVTQALGTELAPAGERGFEDGEHKLRPLINESAS